MPEDIEKILELAERPAPRPQTALPISKSARFCRASAFLALGGVMVYWMVVGLVALVEGVSIAEATTTNLGELSELIITIFFLAGIYLLPCLAIVVAITAVMGFVSAKRCPGNRRVVIWALVLSALALASFFVPLAVYLARSIRLF